MNLLPEILFLKWLRNKALIPFLGWVVFLFVAWALYTLIVGIPVILAALWPGWAIGLVTAYLGTVIVRLLR